MFVYIYTRMKAGIVSVFNEFDVQI